ncbi:fatty acid oxidation complex subunit alpha [Actinobacillus equuli]|nr:fatty acid oxidation complex subunit alpha [Actinobacillus equuli]
MKWIKSAQSGANDSANEPNYRRRAPCCGKIDRFIIEAVYEDLKLKQRMLQESEAYYDEHAIFATNTSTLQSEISLRSLSVQKM